MDLAEKFKLYSYVAQVRYAPLVRVALCSHSASRHGASGGSRPDEQAPRCVCSCLSAPRTLRVLRRKSRQISLSPPKKQKTESPKGHSVFLANLNSTPMWRKCAMRPWCVSHYARILRSATEQAAAAALMSKLLDASALAYLRPARYACCDASRGKSLFLRQKTKNRESERTLGIFGGEREI